MGPIRDLDRAVPVGNKLQEQAFPDAEQENQFAYQFVNSSAGEESAGGVGHRVRVRTARSGTKGFDDG